MSLISYDDVKWDKLSEKELQMIFKKKLTIAIRNIQDFIEHAEEYPMKIEYIDTDKETITLGFK